MTTQTPKASMNSITVVPDTNTFTTIVKLISLTYDKPYVAITEEVAVQLESRGIIVKRVVSDRFGASCQVALKIAPDFMRKAGSINRAELQVGYSYEVLINPYNFVYQGKTGISLQTNFMVDLGRLLI